MRAFTNTQVSKEELLTNIREHQAYDRFQKGHFWDEGNATGCGVGCTIHEFARGMESEHSAYEYLFGIPAELAVLEDSLFEQMAREDDLGRWPEEFISSIPEGGDLDRAAGRWLLKVLEHPESPFAHAHERKTTRTAAQLLRHWVQTGEQDLALAELTKEAQEELIKTKDGADHATEVAARVARYITYRTRHEPYTTTQMLLLDSICGFTTTSYDDNQKGVPKSSHFESARDECLDKLSRMLLETLQESPQE